jgi:TPP-dependent 2-oxoacid decarboxylase
MAKIFKTTDTIILQIGDVTVGINPLTFEQKMKVQAEVMKGTSGAMRGAALACRFALKKLSGVENQDGSSYVLEHEDNVLTEKCWDDLQNLQETQKLITVCLNLINGIPNEFVDPQTGNKIDGVTVIKESSPDPKT